MRIRVDHLAQEIIELADKSSNLDRVALQISARLASKMAPSEYGDRGLIEQNVNARVQTVTKIDVSHLTTEELLFAERVLRKALTPPDEVDDQDDD